MGTRERIRCRERLERLAAADLDIEEARRAAIAELRRAIGFERWCWPLTDPGTGLATGGIGEFDFGPSLPRLVALEEHGDIATKPRLIVGTRASVALSAVTHGDLARSVRWRECLHPYHIGDEVMTVCRDRHGCWGSVELMRDHDDTPFDAEDVRLLEQLAPTLGAIVRRGLARSWAHHGRALDSEPLAPDTLILNSDLSPAGWTASVRSRLMALAGGDMLPAAIFEIGARVLTPPEQSHGLQPGLRLRAASGQWSVIEGARLDGGNAPRVAITVRAATGGEIVDMLCRTHALTTRERELVNVLRGGLDTRQAARTLGISEYTVQDHLKAIFTKIGVRSRGDLLSHLAGSAATGF
jgi:DNA-binding CsgD family transcriptional regulator